MASVYVSIGPVKSADRGAVAAFVGNLTDTEVITSSGTTARGALTAPAGAFAQVFCASAVYATTGPAATVTATATNGTYIPAGIPMWLQISTGEAVAVIDV